MNSAIIILSILVSLQIILGLPTTTLIHRSEQLASSKQIHEKCFGQISPTGYLPGFLPNNLGGVHIPFTQEFYYSINNNYGYSTCNSYPNNIQSFGNCATIGACHEAYTGYTNLLSGVGNLAGGLLNTVGGVVGNLGNTVGGVVGAVGNTVGGVVGAVTGLVGGVLGLLSDKELKENTKQV
ncbi:uncharacterized protein MELLADRAFT_86410 [Melampsora larici-populina 98AG31]|uniref:Secreted protein n=1 Tax=Melampsora larici-populina (strain 98AG31 / pathotype 3-4-7) TaxID=747676 RepID=F4RLP9_MELLP|nr:uncharacterized protein MELLADRAFT_86410 [Melampsora larici-populina 98AG31]EGG06712.1 secreted protein [Melampsora larici-populina 98AG31]